MPSTRTIRSLLLHFIVSSVVGVTNEYVNRPMTIPVKHHITSLPHFRGKDTAAPLYWHIPKSSPGFVLSGFLGVCLKRVVAMGDGLGATSNGIVFDENFDQLRTRDSRKGVRYVNVNTNDLDSLERAKEMDFAGSRLADVVLSPKLYRAAEYLYDVDHPARVFTIMRDPIDRELSLYNGLLRSHPNMTLIESVNHHMTDNYVTRVILAGTKNQLNERRVNRAKWLLYHKTLVGFYENFEASLDRFGRVFGWDQLEEWRGCVDIAVHDRFNGTLVHNAKPKQGSLEWKALIEKLKYDIDLYQYAQRMFEVQSNLDLPVDNVDEIDEEPDFTATV